MGRYILPTRGSSGQKSYEGPSGCGAISEDNGPLSTPPRLLLLSKSPTSDRLLLTPMPPVDPQNNSFGPN